jgi:hypothetical protein
MLAKTAKDAAIATDGTLLRFLVIIFFSSSAAISVVSFDFV